jgi:uncharacterized membrane protein (Fun14 family)
MSEEAAAKSGLVTGLTGLQKLTLALAAAISMAGAGLWTYAATTTPDRPAATDSAPTNDELPPGYNPQGFTDSHTADATTDGTESEPATDKTALELYTPALFRLGFAFFVGFAIAFAIRAALKVVLIVAGAVLLLLIGLQMAGLVTVNWSAMDGMYQSATAWLADQTRSLAAFIRGYIPSGATAATGFGIGLLKKH